ncbi:hypothetical protein H4582DRAFT_291287 [Lactarius indigo]|nr:hypothetical protein H4582DRAFT_291287 [Lactarius indigo]
MCGVLHPFITCKFGMSALSLRSFLLVLAQSRFQSESPTKEARSSPEVAHKIAVAGNRWPWRRRQYICADPTLTLVFPSTTITTIQSYGLQQRRQDGPRRFPEELFPS